MNTESLRSLIDRHFASEAASGRPAVHIQWFGPASECDGMRFSPLILADYLSDLAIKAYGREHAPIGGIHNAVWMLAFAERRAHAALALRNLASLLPRVCAAS